MRVKQRSAVAGLAFLLLAACVSGAGGGSSEQVMRSVPNAGYDAWVAGFRPRAEARGISATTFDTAFQSAGFLPGVIEKDQNQTEFTRTTEDYLAIAASEERISKGRAALRSYAAVLAEIEARYGVPPNVVVAVWGLESFYGERQGNVPVISALSTLAYEGRRGDFFEQQLVAALRILQNGDITPAAMTGIRSSSRPRTWPMPWISPATGGATSGQTMPPMRWRPPPPTWTGPAGSPASPGGWR
jgi:membrane-bound lytic murein transglycosylase B